MLRQVAEEVAISFILSLWPAHVPRPHHHYSFRPAEINADRKPWYSAAHWFGAVPAATFMPAARAIPVLHSSGC